MTISCNLCGATWMCRAGRALKGMSRKLWGASHVVKATWCELSAQGARERPRGSHGRPRGA
eukprot:2416823-Pyramimonas_sp.AAC.1